MISFNELTITEDGKNLIVDVSVDSLSVYDNIYINSIVIDNQNTYTINGPSSTPLYTKNMTGQSVKNIRLILNSDTDFNLPSFNPNIYFIYVIAEGTVINNPIENDETTILGTVYNLYPYYQKMMDFIREIECTCNIPKNFIDMNLKLDALNLSIKVGNYPQTIIYWNEYFKDNYYNTPNCNCYG